MIRPWLGTTTIVLASCGGSAAAQQLARARRQARDVAGRKDDLDRAPEAQEQ